MKPFSGAIRPQEIYMALIPFQMKWPYKIVTEDNKVEIKTELFPEEKEDEFVNEAKEIEIGTIYKLRPVIIIYQSERSDDVYLALPLRKKKDKVTQRDREYILEVCQNQIQERHFLFQSKYSDTLKFDSFVLVDAIHLLSKNNIYKKKGLLESKDYKEIRAKLKKVLSLNSPS
jgi:mRNA-degrading endonuclease toxin of MazEF toxin-antitoxin module